MLNERKKKILQLIIEDYISTAEPVGSRTIARKYDLGLSPATIRNEMSDLELLGYLEQPHTSAGRVPSAQAYRLYVDSLVEPGTLTDNDRALINGWFSERRRSIDEIFQYVFIACSNCRTADFFESLNRFINDNATRCIAVVCCFVAFDLLAEDVGHSQHCISS